MAQEPQHESARTFRPGFWQRVAITTLFFIAAVGCQDETGARVLRLAHGLDTQHPVHQALVGMADDLHTRSGGRMKIVIYPSEQLGSEREALELLQLGSLDMTKVSAAVLEGFAPAFVVTGVPYLFRDEAHRHAFYDHPAGKKLLRETDSLRLQGLTYFDAGARSFYTRQQPAQHPDALHNLRIRTQESPAAIQMVRQLGAAATPIAWGELYTALQQGVVDGAENNPPSYYSSRHYEVAPHFVLNEHTAVPDILLASRETWNRLGPQEQKWLQESADAASRNQRELWRKANQDALEALAKEGVEIIIPDRQIFADRLARLREEYRKREALAPWIDAIARVHP